MGKRTILFIFLLAGFLSMACAFVYDLVFPGSPPTPLSQQTEEPALSRDPLNNPVPITCSDDDCLNACIERIDQVLQTRPYQALPEIYSTNEANINLVQYDVQGDDLLERHELWVPSDFKVYQQEQAAEESIWHFYTSVIPLQWRTDINQFMIFTDGEANVLAWVQQNEYKPDAWTVGFDMFDARNPLYLTESLIHETGHLITLNTEQVTFGYFSGLQNQAKCPQFVLETGCSQPDSYINHFYEKFWVSLYDEWWEQVAQPESTADPEQVVYDFYLNHEAEFISSYAATNIKEDMAESFQYFVMNPKTNSDRVADQKVDFFYDFPELVEARKQIIEGLCAYLP